MTRDGILILDAEQAVIEQANPFVSELLGYSRDELVGRSFRELGIFANRAQGEAIFERVRRDGYVRCDVLPLRVRGDGGVFAEFVGTSYLVDSRTVIAFNVRGVSEFEDADPRPRKGVGVDPPGVLRLGDAIRLEMDSLLETITRLERLSVVDELTGVFNRRGLVILGGREVERARRLGCPLAVLFVDLDNFKSLNDEYSHDVGDQALRVVGRRLQESMRRIDTVARYGGEEFVVLLAETQLVAAVEVGERIRQMVEATNLPTESGTARLTVSIGVTTQGRTATNLEGLIRRADEAMYAAKQAGRNRVVALEN